ncbi:MAG: hypothetical protein M3Q48_10485 [Actinomycetota bacterium]|nr:hypothetical protein [Actinomycetota bacterium]
MRGARVVVAGVTATVLAWSAGPAWAQTTPAPPAEASTVGTDVESIVSVADTESRANQTTGTATANALEVGGTTPVSGTTGTSQNGDGSSSSSLVAPVKVSGVARVEALPAAPTWRRRVGPGPPRPRRPCCGSRCSTASST